MSHEHHSTFDDDGLKRAAAAVRATPRLPARITLPLNPEGRSFEAVGPCVVSAPECTWVLDEGERRFFYVQRANSDYIARWVSASDHVKPPTPVPPVLCPACGDVIQKFDARRPTPLPLAGNSESFGTIAEAIAEADAEADFYRAVERRVGALVALFLVAVTVALVLWWSTT